jgi:WD40 repeat protein
VSGHRRALIVTADRYADHRLRQLKSPPHDASELGKVLGDPEIGGFDVAILANRPAHEVRRAVSTFFSNRDHGDVLLLHFACHGEKSEDGDLYLVTSDTDLDDLDGTALEAAFVCKKMDRSRSKRIMLFLDCCYGGAVVRGLRPRAGSAVHVKESFEGHGQGRVILTASSATEYAWERDSQRTFVNVPLTSVFTTAIVEGLRNGDADKDRDGKVGVDELYEYIYRRILKETPHQTPGRWNFLQGTLYVARNPRSSGGAASINIGQEEPGYLVVPPGMAYRPRVRFRRVRMAIGAAIIAIALALLPLFPSAAEALPSVLRGHLDWVTTVALSPNGRTLASGSRDHTIRLWSLVTGQQTAMYHSYTEITSVAFSPDGEKLLSADNKGTIYLHRIHNLRDIVAYYGSDAWVTNVAFNSDGSRFVSGHRDARVLVWNVPAAGSWKTMSPIAEYRHQADVNSVAFNRNGTQVASASLDKTVRLWDLTTGQSKVLSGHTGNVRSVAFSPDGTILASGGQDHTIQLWKATTGEPVMTISTGPLSVLSLAFAPSGQTVVAAGDDPQEYLTIRIFDIASGNQVRTLAPHSDVQTVTCGPDGRIATGSANQQIRLWR